MKINTNILSISSQNNLQKSTNRLSKTMEKLSSGQRINRAADDAAGLAISKALQAEIKSLNQAYRNANDAVSLGQVAEGGLSQMGDMVGRMRELAMQAGNGTLSDTERGYLNDEYQALKAEVNRISATTEFVGQKPLDGSMSGGVKFQIGTQNTPGDSLSLAIDGTDADSLGLNTSGADDISTAENARAALESNDQALQTISSRRGQIGSFQNRLEYAMNVIENKAQNSSAANSRITDADYAYETAEHVRNQIMSNSASSVLAQANMLPQQALSLLG